MDIRETNHEAIQKVLLWTHLLSDLQVTTHHRDDAKSSRATTRENVAQTIPSFPAGPLASMSPFPPPHPSLETAAVNLVSERRLLPSLPAQMPPFLPRRKPRAVIRTAAKEGTPLSKPQGRPFATGLPRSGKVFVAASLAQGNHTHRPRDPGQRRPHPELGAAQPTVPARPGRGSRTSAGLGAGSSAAGANKGARWRERSLLPRRSFGAAVPRGGQDRPGSPVLQGPRERALRARNTAGAVDPRLQRAFQPVVWEPRGGRAGERACRRSGTFLRRSSLGVGSPTETSPALRRTNQRNSQSAFPARHPGRGGAGRTDGRVDGAAVPTPAQRTNHRAGRCWTSRRARSNFPRPASGPEAKTTFFIQEGASARAGKPAAA